MTRGDRGSEVSAVRRKDVAQVKVYLLSIFVVAISTSGPANIGRGMIAMPVPAQDFGGRSGCT